MCHSSDGFSKVRRSHHVDNAVEPKLHDTSVPGEDTRQHHQRLGSCTCRISEQGYHDDFTATDETVGRINVYDIRIARSLLSLEILASNHYILSSLSDIWISDQFIVFFSDVEVGKWHTVPRSTECGLKRHFALRANS